MHIIRPATRVGASERAEGVALPEADRYEPRAPQGHRSVAQPGSAPVWGTGGRRFKSGHSDHSFAQALFLPEDMVAAFLPIPFLFALRATGP